jgi:hypothetical protein
MATSLVAGLAMSISTGIQIGFSAATALKLVGAFAVGAGLSLVSRALMPKPDQPGDPGQTITNRNPSASRKIIYGRIRAAALSST